MAGGANPAQTQQAPNVFQQSAGNLTQAGNITSRVAGRGTPSMNAAGYNADTYNDAANVQAGQVGGRSLNRYMNPYTDQVIDTTMADMDRARMMAQNSNGAAASAAGAFGGSRHGLVEAETNRAFADQAGQMAAGLRQGGFQNAQQAAFQDIGNTMQADFANQASTNAQRQFNTAARNNQRQFNAGNRQQANAANMGAQFQNRSMDLQAANQLGSLSNLGFGMGQKINSTMGQQGAQQQAAMQALIDASKGQFQGFTGAQQQGLQPLLAALGASPQPTTTTQSKNPGFFDYLSLGAGTAAGIWGG